MRRRTIQVDEKVSLLIGIPLGFQHLFAMFGASVLVPSLFGINPGIVLLMNGIATIAYLFICKGKVPAFLGSSFAFIAPVLLILGADKSAWGANYQLALGGFVIAGVLMTVVALLIKTFGKNWLRIILPPAVIGPVIALIGLGLAETAAKMAGIIPVNGIYDTKSLFVSSITFLVAVFGAVLFRGVLAVIPVLIAIVVGYACALSVHMIDFAQIYNAPFVALPNFVFPKFNLSAIIAIAPAVLVVISEHIGHFMLTQSIIKRDIAADPGIHRSLFGNGIFTIISGFFGSVPNTTYGENISVMTITRVYSVWVIGIAAIISILFAFIGKFTAIIQSIPTAVMGGISLFLFGVIAAAGIRVIVEEKVDYSDTTNLILTSVVLIVGISGAAIHIGVVQLTGMPLATVIGIILSIIFYLLTRFKLTND